MGANLIEDLKFFLLGRITSISVERLMIYAETTGLGIELTMVSCSYWTSWWLLLTYLTPNISFFSSVYRIEA